MEIAKSYTPGDIEKKWRHSWNQAQAFNPDTQKNTQGVFSIVIPPPNVTGVLHIGHALDNTLQDIIVRHARKQGKKTLWVPGTDHAGIATQNVVERELAKTKQTKEQLGRDKFIETVWQWKNQCEGGIVNQLSTMGASPDWSRKRFTMDEGLSRAVRKVFVQLYHEGLIYQAPYIVNWCPKDKTALSDIEVEWEDRKSSLWHIRYPRTDNPELFVTVATTRPETLFGDVAVAVHPDDDRFRGWIGKHVKVPFVDRPIPIIADAMVDPAFGSGAVKITPAHDFNDFEVGRRHQLTPLTVMNTDATMNSQAGPFAGLSREECRKQVVAQLETLGLLDKTEPHQLRVGKNSRSGAVVEPMISSQWFVKTKPLAEKAIAAVESGQTRFVPDQYKNLYFEWMRNIRDWCISRQIWWGHRIPVWSCQDCGKHTVSESDPTECQHCHSKHINQEPDVLDTWFSSGIWPMSTMGWPENTEDFKTFYPTTTLVTGFDIIFFWVARMMMMGIHFTGKPPFKDVVIHGLVRDAHGKKMSKSKGNVVDPLDLMHQYGSDAVRFTLAALCNQGRDINLSHERLEGYRNFINKLWNASRFVFMNMGDYQRSQRKQALLGSLTPPDQWILGKLAQLHKDCDKLFADYKFADLADSLYHFLWNDFCDWYIEISKVHLQPNANPADALRVRAIMDLVLEQFYHRAHPVIPYITEELNQLLDQAVGYKSPEFVITSKYAQDIPDQCLPSEHVLEAFAQTQSIIGQIRNIRATMQLSPKDALEVWGTGSIADPVLKSLLHESWVTRVANLKSLNPNGKNGAAVVTAGAQLTVPLEGLDLSAERSRLQQKQQALSAELARWDQKLSDPTFVSKAPSEIIEGARKDRQACQQALEGITNLLAAIG